METWLIFLICLFASVSATAAGATVVEFYNTNLDNYFITANAGEAAAIDGGSAGPGWIRTGNTFDSGGPTSVCRFYGSMSPGPNSHFYTADAGECDYLKQLQATTPDTEKRWNFESLDFLTTLPTVAGINGACPTGTTPVYRAYNNGFARGVDSNHRIASSQAAIQEVVARGWNDEGVVMCAGAPMPPTSNPSSSGLPLTTGAGIFTVSGRSESALQVVVPTSRGATPPLIIAFHGTGGEPVDVIDGFGLAAMAEKYGFIVIAPRAGYRDTPHPADVDHILNSGGSSWNMWTASPDANEDLDYIRLMIDAAHTRYGVDTSRVYTMGFSNGAFFSYFVAASLPDQIAGFSENSGGWTSDACPTRYDVNDSPLYLLNTAGTLGENLGCARIFSDPAFPQSCRLSATNHLRPPALSARVPFGYIGHYSNDDTVSVVWSCLLAEALGSRAQATIRFRESDGTDRHSMMPDFVDQAWKAWAGRTNKE